MRSSSRSKGLNLFKENVIKREVDNDYDIRNVNKLNELMMVIDEK